MPARVGRFEVRECLGEGAFGTVYRAYDPRLDREVALKLPRAGTLDTPTRVKRFLREAKAAARLTHPHVVPVYDAGQADGRYYIASAYVAGSTLAAALDDGPFEPRRAAAIVRDLAGALAYAHGEGVVHRDVKPANVLLDADGRPHLADFGLAYSGDGTDRLTQEGALLGTPAYMSPEQAAGRGEPLPASDQYSLGVVLYELLCGRTPFQGPAVVLLCRAVRDAPEPPSCVNPAVPTQLEAVCLKTLEKDPARRYPGCGDLADDLGRWLDGQPVRTRPLGAVARGLRWCRRRPLVVGLAAAVALCLLLTGALGGIVVALLAGRGQPPPVALADKDPGPPAVNPTPADGSDRPGKGKTADGLPDLGPEKGAGEGVAFGPAKGMDPGEPVPVPMAQQADPRAEARKQFARLMDEGAAAIKARDYVKAAFAYAQASFLPTGDDRGTALAGDLAELALLAVADAKADYGKHLGDAKKDLDRARKDRIAKRFAEGKKLLADANKALAKAADFEPVLLLAGELAEKDRQVDKLLDAVVDARKDLDRQEKAEGLVRNAYELMQAQPPDYAGAADTAGEALDLAPPETNTALEALRQAARGGVANEKAGRHWDRAIALATKAVNHAKADQTLLGIRADAEEAKKQACKQADALKSQSDAFLAQQKWYEDVLAKCLTPRADLVPDDPQPKQDVNAVQRLLEEAKANFNKLMDDGNTAFLKKDYATAYLKFNQALNGAYGQASAERAMKGRDEADRLRKGGKP
jgi:tRNA A-37 threonylcarbamoyl transferase component Bud32